MANDWKQLFSEYPVLQSSIICQKVTTSEEGERTYHHEISKIPQSGIEEFTLVHVWHGQNTGQSSFYEIIDLIGPDGELICRNPSEPFQIYGSSYRHYNYFIYTKFVFQKKGVYELHSKLFKGNRKLKHKPLVHENYFLVV